MPSIIIADTSCLIVLDKIGELELLKSIYSDISITPEIAQEFDTKLPDWISIVSAKDKKYQELLSTQIDIGEASAIALAMENDNSLIILDDLKARKIATKLNLNFTGLLGVIYKAKKSKIIPHVKPLLEKISKTNFHISTKLIDEILKMSNE